MSSVTLGCYFFISRIMYLIEVVIIIIHYFCFYDHCIFLTLPCILDYHAKSKLIKDSYSRFKW